MPLVRSEPTQLGEHGAWSLAPLVMANLFLTTQALGVPLSERLLVTLLTTLAVSGSLQNLAVLMVLQMLLAMAAGMIAIWWLSVRVNQLGLLGTPTIPGSGE